MYSVYMLPVVHNSHYMVECMDQNYLMWKLTAQLGSYAIYRLYNIYVKDMLPFTYINFFAHTFMYAHKYINTQKHTHRHTGTFTWMYECTQTQAHTHRGPQQGLHNWSGQSKPSALCNQMRGWSVSFTLPIWLFVLFIT